MQTFAVVKREYRTPDAHLLLHRATQKHLNASSVFVVVRFVFKGVKLELRP